MPHKRGVFLVRRSSKSQSYLHKSEFPYRVVCSVVMGFVTIGQPVRVAPSPPPSAVYTIRGSSPRDRVVCLGRRISTFDFFSSFCSPHARHANVRVFIIIYNVPFPGGAEMMFFARPTTRDGFFFSSPLACGPIVGRTARDHRTLLRPGGH